MANLKHPITLATIGAPHGVRGELRVKSYTQDPLAFGDYGPLCDKNGNIYEVDKARPAKNVIVVRFKSVTTREMAEKLTGLDLMIERDALGDDLLDEEEYFHEDLIGLDVRDEDGQSLGKIRAVHDFGAGELLEVGSSVKTSKHIPFTHAAVPQVNIEGGFIVVCAQEAGLLETDDKQQDEEGDANQ